MPNIVKPLQWWDYNRDNPLAHGLVGLWPFWEGMGTTAQDMAGPNNGTLDNGVTWALGENGLELDFVAGSSQCVSADAPVTGAPLTMMCRATCDDATGFYGLMSLGNSSALNRIRLSAGGTVGGDPIYGTIRSVAGTINWPTTSGYTANEPFTATIVLVSATERHVYINGGSVGTNTANRTPTAMTDFRIGCNVTAGANDNYLNGRIEIAAVWNRALPVSEIQSVHGDFYQLLQPPDNIPSIAAATLAPSGITPTQYYNLFLRGVA